MSEWDKHTAVRFSPAQRSCVRPVHYCGPNLSGALDWSERSAQEVNVTLEDQEAEPLLPDEPLTCL